MTILWVTLQIVCCCFLPISLLIIVYHRRKRSKKRSSVYSTRDRNTSIVQMQTISYPNYQRPGRPRQSNNYALQTAQIVSSPNHGNQQVVRAIPIGANTLGQFSASAPNKCNDDGLCQYKRFAAPHTCAACATDIII